jgi:YVTN family beta-propeller protein
MIGRAHLTAGSRRHAGWLQRRGPAGARRLLPAACCLLVLAPLAAQQPAAPAQPPKPGVPAVQHPMARIVPDAEYAITGSPDWLAMGENQVWTNSRSMDIVSRMDPSSSETVAVVPVRNPCSGLVIAEGTLWVPSCTDGAIYRIDTRTNMVVARVAVTPAHNEGGIAYGAGSIWQPSAPPGSPSASPAAATYGAVTRVDPATNGTLAVIPVAAGSYTAVFGYGRVWVSSTEKSVVSVIHPATNKVIAEIPVDTAPRFMAAGEGYVWTLNQGQGTVTKIDPVAMKAVATIDVGVPGGGGDISAGEGAVWVTARDIPVSRIDVAAEKVSHQFVGPGGDAIRVLHGSVWLSNGRWSNVWRFQASKILNALPASWTARAHPADLTGDGRADLLVEDLAVWFPGQPTTFRMTPIGAGAGTAFTLSVTLNGKKTDVPFVRGTGGGPDEYRATFTGPEPRWIHYSVCAGAACSTPLVVASPTTALDVATKKVAFVPAAFAAPGPPRVGNYVWNILEPAILKPDYQALLDRDGRTGPVTITLAEDYGELKRHEWEFQNHTAFAYGILTPDRQEELACVYINPSPKAGYDATVRLWVTKQGAAAGLEPVLEKAVREWVKARWPFKSVAYPGRDIPTAEWNALPAAGSRQPASGSNE